MYPLLCRYVNTEHTVLQDHLRLSMRLELLHSPVLGRDLGRGSLGNFSLLVSLRISQGVLDGCTLVGTSQLSDQSLHVDVVLGTVLRRPRLVGRSCSLSYQ